MPARLPPVNQQPDFETLTPDAIITAVERAVALPLSGFTSPLPSYINRVYELQAEDGTRLIAKFYRPGRWSHDALEDEHDFLQDCEADEIPVIAPLTLSNGETLGLCEGIHFAVFPKRSGRQFELEEPEAWLRIGRLLGRLHTTGSLRPAAARMTLHPQISTAQDVRELLEGGFVSPTLVAEFRSATSSALEAIIPLFDDVEFIRVHGDCHRGNLIFRPDEGVFIIDFDDMMTGPPVQDFWMLLPGHVHECRHELTLMEEGYEEFRSLDYRTLRLMEPLRLMRMIYFLAWCSRQVNDFQFRNNFPAWGSHSFWEKEIRDIQHQLEIIKGTSSLF